MDVNGTFDVSCTTEHLSGKLFDNAEVFKNFTLVGNSLVMANPVTVFRGSIE